MKRMKRITNKAIETLPVLFIIVCFGLLTRFDSGPDYRDPYAPRIDTPYTIYEGGREY